MPSSCFERTVPVESVLILDDDPDELDRLRRAFEPRVALATTRVAEALELAKIHEPDLAVIDLWLGHQSQADDLPRFWRRHSSGIDVIRQLRDDHPDMIIVLFSRSVSDAHRLKARVAGANGAIPKLLGAEKVRMIVEGGHLETPAPTRPPSLRLKEHDYVAERYLANGCNATRAARDLGISLRKLYKLLHQAVPPD